MNDLIKIKDVSDKYDITARTLRYYEDMGLINSIRSDDYAYRMYDGEAIKRLEQILILRKLNISIKDIQCIFNTSGSGVLLEVLGKKVVDIDGEVALLRELKEILLVFISQIRQTDFSKDSDVKLLYDKVKDIENHISENNVEKIGNKTLYILPNHQWNNGVIIPLDLGNTTLADYNKFTYRVKSSTDVYNKGMSAYVSATAHDFGYWLVGNNSKSALFTNNQLVDSGPSGTNWLNGEVILNLTETQKALTGKIYLLIGINDMWDGSGISYQIDDICLHFTNNLNNNILIDFESYPSGPAPSDFIGRGGSFIPSFAIIDENAPNINRLFELSEKLKKTPEVRIIRLPKCRMATSGEPCSYDEVFKFMDWWSEYDKKRHAVPLSPPDFFFGTEGGFVFWIAVENDAVSEDCGGYDIFDFEGGLFAVHTSIDDDFESGYLVTEKVKKWLKTNTNFEFDNSYPYVNNENWYMGHMIDDEDIKQGLGYYQYELFIPIKSRR